MPYHQNTFSERKLSNTTMVSTSLNGPNNKQNISNKNYDKSSNKIKNENAQKIRSIRSCWRRCIWYRI